MSQLREIATRKVRFTDVVARCGTPSVHLKLIAPARDARLKHEESRGKVMSVHQALRGGGADYGTVGISKENTAQIWIFPRSLNRYRDARIIGIKYELLKSDPAAPSQKRLRREEKKQSGKQSKKAALAPGPAVDDGGHEDHPHENHSHVAASAPPISLEIVGQELRKLRRKLGGKPLESARKFIDELVDRIDAQADGS
jgi:hypothetical protein